MTTAMATGLDWHAEDLWLASRALVDGLSIELLPETGSTNADALARLRGGDAAPALFIAERQTAGRGRLGRAWWSAPGASLTFSLALPLAPADWGGLSLAVGLAVAEALDPLGGPLDQPGAGASPRIGLKWPNDLWLLDGERKLAGILIETASLSAGLPVPAVWPGQAAAAGARFTIIGVGLNIAARPDAATGDRATFGSGYAGLQEIDAALDAPAALARLLPGLLQALRRFEQQGFAPLCPAYARRDLLRGRGVTAGEQGGRAAGVDPNGALLLDVAAAGEPARLQPVISGEVSVRPC